MKRSGPATVFRDLLLGVIGLLILVIFIQMIQIGISKKTTDGQTPPGSITAFITWPQGNTDIDLWLAGPGEPNPVGYSNKGGVLWNLLRDDLGTMPDLTDVNMESGYSRGAPMGEWIVNIHCFRCPILPQKVNVEISSSKSIVGGGKGTVVLATVTVELRANGQERTAIRFKLDEKGDLVSGSINSVYRPLRAAEKTRGFGE